MVSNALDAFCYLNKYVFRERLNTERDEAWRKYSGSEFQARGPANENAYGHSLTC